VHPVVRDRIDQNDVFEQRPAKQQTMRIEVDADDALEIVELRP